MLVQSKITYNALSLTLVDHVKNISHAEPFNASIIGIFGVEKIGVK